MLRKEKSFCFHIPFANNLTFFFWLINVWGEGEPQNQRKVIDGTTKKFLSGTTKKFQSRRLRNYHPSCLEKFVRDIQRIILKLTCAGEIRQEFRLTSNHICSSIFTIHLKNKKMLSERSSNICLLPNCRTNGVHRLFIYSLCQGPSNMINTVLFLPSRKQYY
jgi:hypothetical protein